MMENRFNEFKEEILKRAKDASACKGEYARAYSSESFEQLMQVIKDNFSFACNRKGIDPSIIEKYEKEFNENDIWCNVNRDSGYLLVANAKIEYIGGDTIACIKGNATVQDVRDNATVRDVRDNATVWNVRDNATVQDVRDNATVQDVWDNATVWNVWDNATVQDVWDNAYVSSYSSIECKLHNKAILRIRESDTIRCAAGINIERVQDGQDI